MTIDQKFIDQFVNVTSKAAIASYSLVGKNDKVAAGSVVLNDVKEYTTVAGVPAKKVKEVSDEIPAREVDHGIE